MPGKPQKIQGKDLISPPQTVTDGNKPRRVGVELEFGDISPGKTAEVVQQIFGGQLQKKDPYRLIVKDTELGDFLVELDTTYAHPSEKIESKQGFLAEMGNKMAEAVGDISKSFVPMEIACPPVDIEEIAKLEKLVSALRDAKATGTNKEIYYAFGCQLNPELASLEVDHVLKHFKAWLLLEDWLRDIAANDLSRHLTVFANPFSRRYAQKVLAKSYQPDWKTFIDDYLEDNATRNRGLDMLPLLAHVDKNLKKRVGDDRIKPRPTFHYRIPDSRIDEKDWSLTLEWNRWVQVEKLAENPEKLEELRHKFTSKYWRRKVWAREVAKSIPF